VLSLLGRVAIEELGDGATPLDWVLHRVESGRTFVNIAAEIGEKLGPDWRGPGTRSGPWNPSRAWVSFIAHRMACDAKQRIAKARSNGAKPRRGRTPRLESTVAEVLPVQDRGAIPLEFPASQENRRLTIRATTTPSTRPGIE